MSISFLQVPDSICSGFNPMDFVVSSTASHNTQFRFNSELRDSASAVIASFVSLKQPTYGNLLFDAHRTIENYLSYDITNLINQTTGWNIGVNVFKEYTLAVTEEYPRLSFHASGISTTILAVNSSMDNLDFINLGLGGRFASNSSRKWMTNQPSRIPIRIDDSYELGAIDGGSPIDLNLSYLKIETYNAAGTLVQTATIDNPHAAISTNAKRFPAILVGPDDLNATTLTTGVQPLIVSTTKYYRVAAFNAVNTQTLEWKYFDLDTDCLRDDYVRIFFLNQMGRFDAFNFTGVTDDNIEVSKATYKKLLGVLGLSTFTRNTYQHETSIFYSKIKQSYKLRSGFIDTDTAEWLKELIASPLCYMIVGTHFVAINVDETRYQSKKTISEKLFNIELNISLATDSQRQRL